MNTWKPSVSLGRFSYYCRLSEESPVGALSCGPRRKPWVACRKRGASPGRGDRLPIYRNRRNALVAACIAVFIFCQTGFSQQNPEGKPLVLRGATVIDGSGRAPIQDGVIVIEGDKVKAVGGRGISYPPDATVLDVAGKFIIPGLFDMHTHYRPWLGEMFLNHGVTSVAIPGNPDYDVTQRANSYRPETRSPRIFSTAGRLPVTETMNRAQVQDTVREWLKKKPDYASLLSFNERNAQVYAWTVELLHEAGLMVFGHTEDAPGSIRAGHDSVEHLWGFAQMLMTPQELDDFRKGKYLHWGLFFTDQARIDQMIQDAVAKGTYLNPTLVYELGSLSSLARAHEAQVYNLFRDEKLMTYFPQNLAEAAMFKLRAARNFSDRYENQAAFSVLSPNDREQFYEAYRLSGQFLKKWVAAGGRVMGGTDDPASGTAGLTLHMEMAMMVEMGLTPMQALQSATGWAAAVLDGRRKVSATPTVGVIAEGAYADLVVLSANPLVKIDDSKKIDRVMKGGRFVPLGYSTNYGAPRADESRIVPYTPAPEISSITPYVAVEGSPDFEMTIHGVGFVGNSVVRVDGIPVPTMFVNIRTLRAKIPAAAVSRSLPNRFNAPGPEQNNGVYGDKTIKITVFNGPPDGGLSNSVSLRVVAKWMADRND